MANVWADALDKRAAELRATKSRGTAVAHEFAAAELTEWAAMMRDAGQLANTKEDAMAWLFWSTP
jgi:hypothetical protein